MAIEIRENKRKPTVYRVYWTNPHTKKREHKVFEDVISARLYDAKIQHCLAKDPGFFNKKETPVTFQSLALEYLKKQKMSPSTRDSFIPSLKRNIFKHFPTKPLMEVTLEDVVFFEGFWEEKGLKENSRYTMFSIIRTIINWGVSKQIIPHNPLKGWKVARGVDDVIPPITRTELNLIYQNASPHIKRVIILATSLGCRVGQSELFKLQWLHVDWEEKLIYVPSAKKNKNVVRRDICINQRLFTYLKKWEEEDKAPQDRYIIYYKTNKKSLQSIHVGWKKALRLAGITRRIRPYDLRHLFATRTLSAGMPIKAVAETMGHANPRMILERYQHVLEKDRRAVVESSLLPDDEE